MTVFHVYTPLMQKKSRLTSDMVNFNIKLTEHADKMYCLGNAETVNIEEIVGLYSQGNRN